MPVESTLLHSNANCGLQTDFNRELDEGISVDEFVTESPGGGLKNIVAVADFANAKGRCNRVITRVDTKR